MLGLLAGLLLALLADGVRADTRTGRVIGIADGDSLKLLVAGNRPGPLFRLLEPLARNNVSMKRIESRPSRRGMWDYGFFIDLDDHTQDPPVAKALAEPSAQASLFQVLGSYPKGVL